MQAAIVDTRHRCAIDADPAFDTLTHTVWCCAEAMAATIVGTCNVLARCTGPAGVASTHTVGCITHSVDTAWCAHILITGHTGESGITDTDAGLAVALATNTDAAAGAQLAAITDPSRLTLTPAAVAGTVNAGRIIFTESSCTSGTSVAGITDTGRRQRIHESMTVTHRRLRVHRRRSVDSISENCEDLRGVYPRLIRRHTYFLRFDRRVGEARFDKMARARA